MAKYYVILQKWEGDDTESLCMEYQPEHKDECDRMFQRLRLVAAKKKQPVTYRIVELDGELQYPGKEDVDRRKALGVQNVIITNGKVYDDVPTSRLQIDT